MSPLDGTTASQHRIAELLNQLDKLNQEHQELWKSMVVADGGNVFPMDLYVQAVLNRSGSLVSGFTSLVRAGNYHCAASLVRLHLDSALRLSAAWLVEDPHKFVIEIMQGKNLRDLRDRRGERLYDRYLVKQISKEFSWVTSVYDETCAFVHLSEKHIFQGFERQAPGDEPGTFTIRMGAWRSPVPDEAVEEGLSAMVAITELVLHYVAGWIVTKDPERREEAQVERAMRPK